jgi:hypothetical protein
MSQVDLKAQIEFSQKLYDHQIARRDSIRTTLGVPLAVLSFAAFGFGALATQFRVAFETEILAALFFLLAYCTLVGFLMFLASIVLIFRIDYPSRVALPRVLDLEAQRSDMEQTLGNVPLQAGDRAQKIEDAVLNGIHEEFVDKASQLEKKNDHNLSLQQIMLRRLMVGLGCLITAIVLTIAMRVAVL